MLKRIVVCSRCNHQIMPDGTVDKMKLPEFRTDHGSACCCMACVLKRGELRQARGGRYPTSVSS